MLVKMLPIVGLVWCLLALAQARKESTVEECEQNLSDSLKPRLCQLRQYETVDSEDMDRHMHCVLEVVGFVKDSGDVASEKLLEMLKVVDSSHDHVSNVEKCAAESSKFSGSKMANTFYTCFLGTSSESAFKNAVDYVELLRAGKLKQNAPFDANQVSALIKEIDDGLC
ncbi:37 kDa salivary gland allergen Aed a 2-like [Anopheles nili]|uniref:37 kDa salivary gland allergen Aed a 2-like n=1 Tax=Anopheles nili TaxID=185578 RepID=UPI00237AEF0B|nr:37 kDa salivary gland allergen Aed a 2-like [Anopheles nili]